MEPNNWPLDPIAAAELVSRVVDEIDAADEEALNCLLSDLLCAAWGSLVAQNQ
jgi:hypothetical protein